MKKARKGTLVFCLSMAVSLAVLGGLFLLVLWVSRTDPALQPQSGVTAAPARRPVAADSLQLLLVGGETDTRLPTLFQVLRYDAPSGTLYALLLPCDTLAALDGVTDTLQGHYARTGTRGVLQAVSDLLSTDLSFYLRFTRDDAAAFCDVLGGVAYTFEEDTVLSGTLFYAGFQQLDGRRFAAALFANDSYNRPRLALQHSLTERLLQSRMDAGLPDRYAGLLSRVFAADTNLSRYELARRELSLLSTAKEGRLTAKAITLTVYPLETGGSRPDWVSLYGMKALLTR